MCLPHNLSFSNLCMKLSFIKTSVKVQFECCIMPIYHITRLLIITLHFSSKHLITSSAQFGSQYTCLTQSWMSARYKSAVSVHHQCMANYEILGQDKNSPKETPQLLSQHTCKIHCKKDLEQLFYSKYCCFTEIPLII
jgi:hypothetical protein